jgi:hypothetical protein
MNAPVLTRLFYISEIQQPLSALDVQTILGTSQVRNRRADVTGMLVQTAGHFLQVLEGRGEVVEGLMARIAGDARHRAVRRVLQVNASRRLFADWWMALAICPELSPELTELHRVGTLSFDDAIALMVRIDGRRAANEAAWS